MRERRVAERYAEAVFGLARGRGTADEVRGELEELAGLVREAPEVGALLARPDIKADRKLEALSAAFGDRLSKTLSALVGVLVRHGRGGALGGVAQVYGELSDEAAGVVRAEVETVVPLTESQRGRLVRALERLAGGKVRLEERTEERVLAGARVRLGDRLIDGSAAGQLARMREELTEERGRNQ